LRYPTSSTFLPYTTLFRSIADVDLTGDIAAGTAVEIDDVQLSRRRPVVVDVRAPRHLQQIRDPLAVRGQLRGDDAAQRHDLLEGDRKSTRLNSSHVKISYA